MPHGHDDVGSELSRRFLDQRLIAVDAGGCVLGARKLQDRVRAGVGPRHRRASVLYGEHEDRADVLANLGAVLRERGEVLLHGFRERVARALRLHERRDEADLRHHALRDVVVRHFHVWNGGGLERSDDVRRAGVLRCNDHRRIGRQHTLRR